MGGKFEFLVLLADTARQVLSEPLDSQRSVPRSKANSLVSFLVYTAGNFRTSDSQT
jgi:hypothetical protein